MYAIQKSFFHRTCLLTAACISLLNGCRPGTDAQAADAATSNAYPTFFQNGGMVIADNGKSLAPIILPANATPYMETAAEDLAVYIEKISKAKPAIQKGMPAAVPAKAIWVGMQPGIEKFFPGTDFSFSNPEEIIMVANQQYLLLAGRDKWDPAFMTIPDRTGKKMITGIQQEYGTCNAVYAFLQDHLGVRWFWPGTSGEDYPVTDKLTVAPFAYRYHPDIQDRSGVLQLMRITNNKTKDEEQNWARFQRIQLGSQTINPGHAFINWWEKYGTTHPEYFALLPNGKRMPQANPDNVKICMSNPDVWNVWMQQVANILEKNPVQTIFSAAANDGWSQGHCTCANCKAWDGPPAANGKPILSDREVTFANKLAGLLEKKYPGKGYQVLIMAYGFSRPAPQKAKPAPNVLIAQVSNFHLRDNGKEDERDLAMQQYADWGKLTSNLSWRPNLGSPAGLSSGMPDIDPVQASTDFRHVATYGCKGLYFDSYWNHWSTQGLQYYMVAQLAWNPKANPNAILKDYYQRCYGPAAPFMEQYWQLMIDTRTKILKTVKHRNRFEEAIPYYQDAWYSKASELLQQAYKACRQADKKYTTRIEFAEAGLKFTQLVVSTKKNMLEWEQNPANTSAKNKVLDNWKTASGYKGSFPKYAINWNKVFSNPTSTPMRGMHPDNPTKNKKAKPMETMAGFE